MKKGNTEIIADENLINKKIYFIRGQKVMIDRDLAELYGVLTKNLNQAVKRNKDRFPEDFMFQLTKDEYDSLRFQFGTLRKNEYQLTKAEHDSSRLQFATLKRGSNLKYLPYAFTEQGVAMLSSVLNSKQAIAVNIKIIRVFTKMREIINSNKEILLKLDLLENKVGTNSEDIEQLFEVIRNLADPETEPRQSVGFKWKEEED